MAPPRDPLTAGFFTELVMGYRRAKTVLAANELGVFDVLSRGEKTAAEVAAELSLDARCTEVLLHALRAIGVVRREAGRFANEPVAATFLVEGSDRNVARNMRFQNAVWEGWSSLEDIVRSGEPWKGLGELLAQPAFAESYIMGMLPVAAGSAATVARILGEAPYRAVLDVGCGPGAYGLALKEQRPEAEVTLFDLPSTLVVTEKALPGATARFAFQPGDYLTDSFGEARFDLVLMSHVTHDEGPEDTRRLFEKAHRALVPGGRLAVHDWVLDPGGADDEWAALFAVHVMTYTRRGKVYRQREYELLMEEAGFQRTEHRVVGDAFARSATSLIIATR